MFDNIILLTDSYKITHYLQYPQGTTGVYSYLESRGGKFPSVIFFGLQYLLKKHLEGKVVTKKRIKEAEKSLRHLFPDYENIYNRDGWHYILDNHNGRLPVSIRAVPEGEKVDNLNVLMTIENTDDNCYWLTNYLETLLMQVWYPITVATISFHLKELILDYLYKNGTPEQIDFKLHDFGFRGVSSVESAAIGGSAHLVNFMGTDTLVTDLLLNNFYNSGKPKTYGFSIPASEHSTMTAWGKDGEIKAMRNMLDKFPHGLLACVSDSYDIYNACTNIWGNKLRDRVISRDGVLVIRPDSGDPSDVVRKVIEILGERFGYELNKKGYKVLHPRVRVIQGDGMNYEKVEAVLSELHKHRWSADNINFGMGSGLLQKLNRDTQQFALKCSAVKIDDEWRDVYKKPVDDPEKISKKGRLKLIKSGYGFKTVKEDAKGNDQLVEVFRDGVILKEYDFNSIRERAQVYLNL